MEVSRRVTEKEKKLIVARTRTEQYYDLEDHDLKFDHRE